MKLAILSDIHANQQALEAVLADIKQQGADQIIVNGDMVNRGPNNLAVMERVWQGAQQEGFTVLLGNHDDLMRKWVDRDDDLPADWFDSPFWTSTAWAAAQLEQAGWIETFRSLPLTHRVEIAGAPSVLIAHGTPRHYREGLSPRLSDESISEILQMHPADVLVGSHTHDPMQRTWGRHLILNTGAVGVPFNRDPRAQYLILNLKHGSWQPVFRRVSYDRVAALDAFHTSGYLTAGGLSSRLFQLEVENARSYLTPFWMWTEKQGLDQSEATWQQFRAAFPERFEAPVFN